MARLGKRQKAETQQADEFVGSPSKKVNGETTVGSRLQEKPTSSVQWNVCHFKKNGSDFRVVFSVAGALSKELTKTVKKDILTRYI